MKRYEKTAIMMKQILEDMGFKFNNTLNNAYKPYTPSKEQYQILWNNYDLNQNCNKYRWKNLPKGLTSWNLERMLYYYGSLAGFEYGGNIYILPYTLKDSLNCYGFPNKIQPITFNGKTPKQASKDFFGKKFEIETFVEGDTLTKDKAIILMDSIPTATGTFIPLSRFAQNQALIDDIVETLKRININIVISNKKIVIECADEKQADVIREELAQGYSSDSPFMVVTNPNRSGQIAQSGDLQAIELFNVVKQYDSIRCLHSGILTKSFGQDKKERVNSGELMGEKEQVNIIYDVGLYLRKEFAERMNAVFNTNIQCEENEAIKEDTTELKKVVEKNE